MKLSYFAWQGNVYECEVLSHLRKDDEGKWYAVLRPSVSQRAWVQAPGMQPNGHVAVPANIVRTTRQEAEADIAIGALRNFGRDKEALT